MRTRDPLKEQLVKQKAIELLGSDGLEGFSVNKLARACSISVATLYIYYKDKDDLIIRLAQEEGFKMGQSMIKELDPESSFEEGLRVQWRNRHQYMMANPHLSLFFEQLRSSTYQQVFLKSFRENFEATIHKFMCNVIARGEINKMPLEVYWSVAFAPLYSLVRFHHEGQSIGGRPFHLTDDMLWQTFDLVVKALRK